MLAGDAIAINMPMTAEAVTIYLGVIYAGCAAVSIADSFAPSEISTRLHIAKAKAIFVQDVILRGGKAHPLYERVLKAQGPTAIVLPAASSKQLQVCRTCSLLCNVNIRNHHIDHDHSDGHGGWDRHHVGVSQLDT